MSDKMSNENQPQNVTLKEHLEALRNAEIERLKARLDILEKL